MNTLYYFIFLLLVIWLFDKTCLWLERKGWLYYRFKKPQKGIMGDVLQELNALIMPSNRHVVVAKKQEVQNKKSIPGACKE